MTNFKHGLMREHKAEYKSWCKLRERCTNKNLSCYKDYGGRGIQFCKCIDKFEDFFKFVGKKPSAKHTIDRFPDKDGNYCGCKNNLRWADKKEQSLNRRKIKNCSSEYKGVYKHKNGWQASSRIEGKLIHIGRFKTEYLAHLAYESFINTLRLSGVYYG